MLQLLLLVSALVPRTDTTALRVRVAPTRPWIEQDPAHPTAPQFLNFDLLVTNGPAPRTLSAVRLSATDARGHLVYQRYCDGAGMSPCIATLPERDLAPGAERIVYNPFHTLPGELSLTTLSYQLVFADTAGNDVDTLRVDVRPRRAPATGLLLPVTGRLLVFDGHDALAHHRRWNLAHPVMHAIGFSGNSGRYAYDLSRVDAEGRMFRGNGDRNEDWYSWEAPVRSPAAGRIVAVANDEPDWEIHRTSLPDSVIFARPIALYGNYIVIDHGQGRFSMIAHLRRGSVRVRPGQRVAAGQLLAKVGYSGSVFTIHTHYQLQDGPAYSAEGVPSYFRRVHRLSAPAPQRLPIRIDGGDFIESR